MKWTRLLTVVLLFSCTAARYQPNQKFSNASLIEDFDLMTEIIETKHPSVYWYTDEDSMKYYKEFYRNAIPDSMTEQKFIWQILNPYLDKIHCGHTSASMSKGLSRHLDGRRPGGFPFYVKVWGDSMVVSGLKRKDSIIDVGTVIHSINHVPINKIVEKSFDYLPEDGYANNNNFIRLSSNFPYYYENIFGPADSFEITYSKGYTKHRQYVAKAFKVVPDTTKKDSLVKKVAKPQTTKPKIDKRLRYRSIYFDSTNTYAFMEVNSFSKGNLAPFFRRSFRKLRQEKTPNLIIDVRYNRGGKIRLSTLLTKFIRTEKFRVSDTVYAVDKSLKPYTKHFSGKHLNNLQMFLMSSKRKDGKYHLGHFERKLYKPKGKNRYKGNVYVIIGGPTFSAGTLFAHAVKGQPRVTIAGEETGGGAYGNSGVMLPRIKLPNTGVRVTIPLFRLVQYNPPQEKGRGVVPDWEIPPSYEAIILRKDKKKEVVIERIMSTYNSLK